MFIQLSSSLVPVSVSVPVGIATAVYDWGNALALSAISDSLWTHGHDVGLDKWTFGHLDIRTLGHLSSVGISAFPNPKGVGPQMHGGIH